MRYANPLQLLLVTEFIHDVKLLISKLITQNFERKV